MSNEPGFAGNEARSYRARTRIADQARMLFAMTRNEPLADRERWRALRYEPREDVTVTDLGDQVVLLDPRNQEMYALDVVGRHIWTVLGERSLGGIAAEVAERYHVELDTAEADLRELIDALDRAGLVRLVDDAAPTT